MPGLQKRSKWTKVSENLKVGDLMLLQNEVSPRKVWPLDLVVGVNHGRDDMVHSVRVKTKANEIVTISHSDSTCKQTGNALNR